MPRWPALFAALCCGVLSGQAGVWKDGPHLGQTTGGDVRDEDIAYGWQAAYEFTDFVSAEISITRHTDELKREDIDVFGFPPGGSIDLEFYAIATTLRLEFCPLPRLYLYAGGGFGFYYINEEAEDIRKALDADPVAGPNGGTVSTFNIDIDNGFGFHWAAGLQILLSTRWELFAEYRGVQLSLDADLETVETVPASEIGKTKITTRDPTDFDYDYGLVRVGVQYRF